jgi:hypothetical protein
MQLAPGPEEGYGSQGRSSGRSGGSGSSRPMSYYGGQSGQQGSASSRQRSKSVADIRQFNRDGRPILHFGKSLLHCGCISRSTLTLFSSRVIHVPGRNPGGIEFCKGRCISRSQASG